MGFPDSLAALGSATFPSVSVCGPGSRLGIAFDLPSQPTSTDGLSLT